MEFNDWYGNSDGKLRTRMELQMGTGGMNDTRNMIFVLIQDGFWIDNGTRYQSSDGMLLACQI